MKICFLLILFLLGAVSPSAFAALQYDAVSAAPAVSLTAAVSETLDAGAASRPGNLPMESAVSLDLPPPPTAGQPLPGALLTVLTGLLLAGGVKRLFRQPVPDARETRSGDGKAGFRLPLFAVREAFFPDRTLYRRQKIVLRL